MMADKSASAADRRRRVHADEATSVRQSLIDELEAAVASRNVGSRADVLRRVTDLLVAGPSHFDGEHQALFDDVMGHLAREIDHSARAAFGQRLAAIPNAPPKVSCALALDDSIQVAGPMLTHSNQLDEETLIAGAKTKSQEHLLAISKRKLLSEGITDVLVERGNSQVVVSTAANAGARFSELGFSTLVTRSEHDEELALTVMSRSEVPRENLLTLFTTASDAVRLKLESQDPNRAALLRDIVKYAADRVQRQSRESSPEFVAARDHVEQLRKAGSLNEEQLRRFADAGRFDETALALSMLIDLPIGAIERAMVNDQFDQLIVITKAMGLSWGTAKAVVSLKASARRGSAPDFPKLFASFQRLTMETARIAIQYFRLRERSAKPGQAHV